MSFRPIFTGGRTIEDTGLPIGGRTIFNVPIDLSNQNLEPSTFFGDRIIRPEGLSLSIPTLTGIGIGGLIIAGIILFLVFRK